MLRNPPRSVKVREADEKQDWLKLERPLITNILQDQASQLFNALQSKKETVRTSASFAKIPENLFIRKH